MVMIAALNKGVTTSELFASGAKVFALSLFVFFIYSQSRAPPRRASRPFSQALPASLKRMIPMMPYGVVVGAVAVFFSDVLGRQLDEFSAPIILPVMLLAILVYEKFSRHTLHLFSAFLVPMLVLSFMGIAEGYQVLVSGEIPGGTSAAELEAALWSETWRNLLMILFLGVHYVSALVVRESQRSGGRLSA